MADEFDTFENFCPGLFSDSQSHFPHVLGYERPPPAPRAVPKPVAVVAHQLEVKRLHHQLQVTRHELEQSEELVQNLLTQVRDTNVIHDLLGTDMDNLLARISYLSETQSDTMDVFKTNLEMLITVEESQGAGTAEEPDGVRTEAPRLPHPRLAQPEVQPGGRPLILPKASQDMENYPRLSCLVCWDDVLDVVFGPCQHVATCTTCALELDTCPVCRAVIEVRTKVFLP